MNNNRGGNNRRRGRSNGGGNPRPQGAGGSGQQLNRIDSRARGNAPQMLEKFRKLAHDAHLNGDRVNAEYYLQFADHYFRVIADTRLRQEEQRLRRDDRWQENGEGDRDDSDESGEFSVESDFPTFDQPPVYTRREREDRPERSERAAERNGEDRDGNRAQAATPEPYRRDEQQGRNGNSNRGDPYQPDYPRADQGQAEAAPSDSAAENGPATPNPYEPEENPFLREARGGRGLRPRREDRRPRRDPSAVETGPGEAAQTDNRAERAVAAGIDPDTLPPAFTARERPARPAPVETAPVAPASESAPADTAPVDTAPVDTGDSAPSPRRRARRKPTTDDAGGTVESVN